VWHIGAPTPAAIAIFYSYHRRSVRYLYRDHPFKSYLKDITLAMRAVLSLRLVGTKLPIRLYVSGERQPRYEAAFAAQGIQVLDAPHVIIPHWANPWHAGSFAKLTALALTDLVRVIVLDVDCIVLRNIDHLALGPAPAVAFHPTRCVGRSAAGPCCWELNSGLMTLAPAKSEHERLLQLAYSPAPSLGGDGGDQAVWRTFFSFVYELPTAYNARKSDNVTKWDHVYILHDIWGTRWSRWWPTERHLARNEEVGRFVEALNVNASRAVARQNMTGVNRSRVQCFYNTRPATPLMGLCDEEPE
jgi:hypothetical protein